MALGTAAREAGDGQGAEEHFLAAERDFPGFGDGPSAELQLASLYELEGRSDEAQEARERWLAFDAGEYDLRLVVAAWHVEAGRDAAAEDLYAEANEVDPFRRQLHRAWADTLARLERHAEAAREYRVARLVPPELDADQPQPLDDEERAELLGLEAQARLAAGQNPEALETARRALELDPDEEHATEVLRRVQ